MPGRIQSVTELVFDPHFQRQGVVRAMTVAAGFEEAAVFGGRFLYATHPRRPANAAAARAVGAGEVTG